MRRWIELAADMSSEAGVGILDKPVIELAETDAEQPEICEWKDCDREWKVTLIPFPCMHEWHFCMKHKAEQEQALARQRPGRLRIECGLCRCTVTAWAWL